MTMMFGVAVKRVLKILKGGNFAFQRQEIDRMVEFLKQTTFEVQIERTGNENATRKK